MVQANVTASLVVAEKPTVRKNIILPYFYQETQGKKKFSIFYMPDVARGMSRRESRTKFFSTVSTVSPASNVFVFVRPVYPNKSS